MLWGIMFPSINYSQLSILRYIASCFPGDNEPCDVNAGYDHSVILTKGGQVNHADIGPVC